VLERGLSGTRHHVLYRMTQRGVGQAETESYLDVLPTASPVAVKALDASAARQAEAEHESGGSA